VQRIFKNYLYQGWADVIISIQYRYDTDSIYVCSDAGYSDKLL